MIRVTVTGNAEQARLSLRAQVWEGVLRAVVFLHAHLLQTLNVPCPPASRPGDPPAKRTGWGQRNVVYSADEKAGSAQVGVTKNAPYLLWLELGTKAAAARPWLLSTVKRLWTQLQAIAGGG